MSIASAGAEIVVGATTKAASGLADDFFNAIPKTIEKYLRKNRAALGTSFEEYLKSASANYDIVKTLADSNHPRSLTSMTDGIFVKINVMDRENEISIDSVDNMLAVSKRLIVSGVGGAGKSMLMKYLFINTVREGQWIPILLNLRDVGKQNHNSVSIEELARSNFKKYDPHFPIEDFNQSLGDVNYLFLLDGFDEVKQSHIESTIEAIQRFGIGYPNTAIIISTRPIQEFFGNMKDFSVLHTMPMNKEQACELARRLWPNSDKVTEFCKLLDEKLFDDEKYHSFAENPLLLSMMGLVFIFNNTIPERIVDFYEEAYEVIVKKHDSFEKEGVYKRDLKCAGMTEHDFKTLFAHFCFKTYFKSKFEFNRSSAVSFIRSSIEKLGIKDISPEEYLNDLISLSLMVEEGQYVNGKYDEIHFSHRSFQTYFAASYVSTLPDEVQVKVFKDFLSKRYYYDIIDFYDSVGQIEYSRFVNNAIKPGVEEIVAEIDKNNDSDLQLLKIYSDCIGIDPVFFEGEENEGMLLRIPDNYYVCNVCRLFLKKTLEKPCFTSGNDAELKNEIIKWLQCNGLIEGNIKMEWSIIEVPFDKIEKIDNSRELFSMLVQYFSIDKLNAEMHKWLKEQNERQAKLETAFSIDDL